jgi:hypothetical protein
MIQCETVAQSATLTIMIPPGMEGHRLKIIIIDKEAKTPSVDTIESMRKELNSLISPFSVNWSRDDIYGR